MKDFSNFELQDFLKNKEFRDWVFNTSFDKGLYWQKVLNEYPEKRYFILKAKHILLNLDFTEYVLMPEEQERLFIKINREIDLSEESSNKKFLFTRTKLRTIAAFLAILIAIGVVVYYFLPEKEIIYKTAFAEEKNIQLPDGSTVLLRANSILHFKESLFDKECRDVWLNGDAIFKIKHLPNNQNFVVHTSKYFGVQDLGTEFLVHARQEFTMVYLHEGAIKLLVNEKNKVPIKTLMMKPGEIATFSNNRPDLIIKEKGMPFGIASWDGKSLLLKNTPMKNILNYLKENYGFKIIVKDSTNLSTGVSGKIPLGNTPLLLESLSAIYGINFKATDSKTLIINN